MIAELLAVADDSEIWRDKAICRNLPYEWWNTGDEGNRLAMALCRGACPVLAECAARAESPVGVVWAGAAYSNTGETLPLCDCGRPICTDSGGGLPGRARRCSLCGVPDRPSAASRLVRCRIGRPRKVAKCPKAVAA